MAIKDRTIKMAGIRDTIGEAPRSGAHGPIDSYGGALQVNARRSSRTGKLNLRAVSDVLESYGLDPIEEIAKVLTTQEPHRARDGTMVLGDDGEPLMKPVVDMDTRVRLLSELAQYTRPKLKSVEVVQKGPELTDEQIERRLESLLAKKRP